MCVREYCVHAIRGFFNYITRKYVLLSSFVNFYVTYFVFGKKSITLEKYYHDTFLNISPVCIVLTPLSAVPNCTVDDDNECFCTIETFKTVDVSGSCKLITAYLRNAVTCVRRTRVELTATFLRRVFQRLKLSSYV